MARKTATNARRKASKKKSKISKKDLTKFEALLRQRRGDNEE